MRVLAQAAIPSKCVSATYLGVSKPGAAAKSCADCITFSSVLR